MKLEHSDADLANSVKDFVEKMKADGEKQRVKYHYLLAEKLGKIESL